MELMDTIALESPGIRLKNGFDVWDAKGKLVLRTISRNAVFKRRAGYFRENSTGKVYRVISRDRTEQLRGVEWRHPI